MSGAVILPSRLDLPAATRLASELRQIEGPITIDGSEVKLLGALGLQALVAASRAAHKRGDSFEITDSSDKMITHMATMGVTPEQLAEGSL